MPPVAALVRIAAVALSAAATLAGCAAPPAWSKPGAAVDVAAQSERDCRRAADRAAGPEFAARQDKLDAHRAAVGSSPDDSSIGHFEQDQFAIDYDRVITGLIAECMTDRGFTPSDRGDWF